MENALLSKWDEIHNKYTMLSVGFPLILHHNTFYSTNRLLKHSQWWSKEKLQNHQFDRLKILLHNTYENVAYYTHLFDTNHIDIHQIKTIDDLKKIPFLTKNLIRLNCNDLKAKGYPSFKFEPIYTGGSTGTPLKLFIERGISMAKQTAFWKVILQEAQCKLSDKYVNLCLHRSGSNHDIFGRCLIISPFNVTQDIPKSLDMIRKHKPTYIISFPSIIFLLATYIIENHIEGFSTLKAIICSGETLYETQRDTIERAFQSRIYSLYLHNEYAAYGFNCSLNNEYHFFPEYGIVELIDKNGNVIEEDGKRGEIVVTGFQNPIFPLIRYKTGDIGIYSSHSPCKCGREYPLIKKIEGRKQEILINGKNHVVSALGLINIMNTSSLNVHQYQIVQERKGELKIDIVKKEGFNHSDLKRLKTNFFLNYGKDFELIIRYKAHIPRTESGKYRYVIQKINVNWS